MKNITVRGKHIEVDGKPFLYLADTWWYGSTDRSTWPETFQRLVKDRKSKGFNAVQIVVGIPPETPAFSDDAKNSGGHPFTKNWGINKKYFDEVDKKIDFLIKNDIVPIIFGGWGHHIDWMGVMAVKRLWKEIISRYSKYPVIFCLCGEVEAFLGSDSEAGRSLVLKENAKRVANKFLPVLIYKVLAKVKRFLSDEFINRTQQVLLRERLEKWSEVARYIKKTDKNNRLLMVHTSSKTTAAELFSDPEWLDINTIQSGHAIESAGFMLDSVLSEKKRPFINLEPWYENIRGGFSDNDVRYAFFMNLLSGAAGMGYGGHGIWQMSRRGENFMRHWGDSNWQDALKYRGAYQIGQAKRFFEEIRWFDLRPKVERITPHWSKRKTQLPILSENEEYVLIYFPKNDDSKEYTISGMRDFKITWKDPKDMSRIDEVSVKEKIKKPKRYDDLLAIIKK